MKKSTKLMKLVNKFGEAVKLQNPTLIEETYYKLDTFAEELDKPKKKVKK